MRMHSNQMLEMARETLELVILRAQCEVAEHPADYLFNRIRDLHHAVELIEGCMAVVGFKSKEQA